MKYLSLILIFLVSVYVWLMLNFYTNDWHYIQPFLIAVLLVYYNIEDQRLYYTFATVAGLFISSFSGAFGLHAIIFIVLIFILKTLQTTLLTSKNILTILLLTTLSFLLFWFFYYFFNLIFDWNLYSFSTQWILIGKAIIINILVTIFLHVVYYNLVVKKHERQPL